MGTFFAVLGIFVVVILVTALKQDRYEKNTKVKSDEELIKEYEELTDRIAREAYAGSKCQGIGSNAAVNATNSRIEDLKMKAATVASELSSRGYTVDRSKMNGQAVKKSSGKASVVGRAVAGGIIAGPTGAIIGAASAIDKNQKNNSNK